VSFAVAAVILVGFARWELRVAEPMLDLRFFRNPRFTAAASSIALIFFVMFGMIFILTQYLQSVLGYSPLEAGVRVLPWALVYMLSAPRSARLVERFGQRRVVSTGLLVVAGGLAILSRSGLMADYPLLVLSLVVTAAGMGMVTAPSTGAIVASLPLNKAGVGSAVNDTTRELGGALGVAVVGSVLSSLYRSDVSARIAGLPSAAHAGVTSLGAALQAARQLPGPSAEMLARAARASYVHAFDLTLVVAVAVAMLASGLVAWLLRPGLTVEPEVDEAVAYEAA
jgi:fucose permease